MVQKLFKKLPFHDLHVTFLLNTVNMCLYTMPMVQLLFVSIYFYQNTQQIPVSFIENFSIEIVTIFHIPLQLV